MSGCYGDYYMYVPGVRPPGYLDGISLLGFYIPPKVTFQRRGNADVDPADVPWGRIAQDENTFYGSDEEFLASLDDPAPGPAKIRLCDAVLFTKADDPLVCRLSHGHPGDHADPDQQRTWGDDR